MSATERGGVISGLERAVLARLGEAIKLTAMGKRSANPDAIRSLITALQAYLNDEPVRVVVESLKPQSFAAFLALDNPSQGLFNQLVSETAYWQLLDQIEEQCFGKPDALVKARPFLSELWVGEITVDPFQLMKDRKYLPVPQAIEAYQKIFGSSLRADAILKLAREAKPADDSEGAAVWVKLSTLAKLFGVQGNPLSADEKGREAYARIASLFIPQVGEAYRRAYPRFGFKNWREGQLTSAHIILTPAGLATWQHLESQSDDDFVIALGGGANTGSWYAGYSVRHARLGIVLAGDQMPQDCIMTGGTIATQPDRFTRFEDLGTDCPGNAYAPVAGGGFSRCVGWRWREVELHFDAVWTDYPNQYFGAAVFPRP